jgi:hypothetical protein
MLIQEILESLGSYVPRKDQRHGVIGPVRHGVAHDLKIFRHLDAWIVPVLPFGLDEFLEFMPVKYGPRPDRLELSHALEDWGERAADSDHIFHLHHLCCVLLPVA